MFTWVAEPFATRGSRPVPEAPQGGGRTQRAIRVNRQAVESPRSTRDSADAIAQRTLTLGVLRGALLDLLATGDVDRTTAAVTEHLRQLR